MKGRVVYYTIAIIALLLYVLGFTCGRGSVKPVPCPEVKCPELISTVDTVFVHDTIRKYISRKEIVYSNSIVHDTIKNVQTQYTENCLTVVDSSNGAYAEMTLCSKEFPSYKPEDLHGSLELSLPADTQRTERYVDTVRVTLKNKRLVLSAGPYIGYGLKGTDIGVGISLGLKLKEW
jgi:hypothetical protein